MRRFFIDSFSFRGVISTNDMFKLISTADDVLGDCYEVPTGMTLSQCDSGARRNEWKLIYSGLDPFCCPNHPEYGYKIDTDEWDEENSPCGHLLFLDLKSGEKKELDYSNTFKLKSV